MTRVTSYITFSSNQQESVLCSCVDCRHLIGSACERERLWVLKSSISPLKHVAAHTLTVNAHQEAANICMSEWCYAQEVLFKVQSLMECKGACSPNKNLENQRKKI